jgi:cation:H+ antiporter
MIIINFVLFLVFLAILIKFAEYAVKYSSNLSRALKLPEFIISFFIIAIISILPELTISIMSAIQGNPELGFGTLLGSNIADLTLIFGIVALFSYNGIKVKSKVLENHFYYLILLLFPLILGFDGKFSRIDGIILILLGLSFLGKIYLDRNKFHKKSNKERKPFLKNLLLLTLSIGIILFSSFLTVKFAVNFAYDIKLSTVFVGLTILAIGTCLPELIFSIKAIRKKHYDLAIGDILGNVLIDTTIVLGLVALISPFSYNPYNIYIMGTVLFLSGIFVTIFMKTEKSINKFEGILLILFYIFFIFAEFFLSNFLN